MLPDTLAALLTSLEQSSLVAALRTSFWAYPLVNAAHIIGIALLVGSIIAYDIVVLRKRMDSVPAHHARLLLQIAGSGLALAILAGLLLFSVKAGEYALNPAFLIKMGLVLLGLINIALVHTGRFKSAPAAFLSILVWISAIIAGRFIAFV